MRYINLRWHWHWNSVREITLKASTSVIAIHCNENEASTSRLTRPRKSRGQVPWGRGRGQKCTWLWCNIGLEDSTFSNTFSTAVYTPCLNKECTASWSKPRTTEGKSGLKWQCRCSANCHISTLWSCSPIFSFQLRPRGRLLSSLSLALWKQRSVKFVQVTAHTQRVVGLLRHGQWHRITSHRRDRDDTCR